MNLGNALERAVDHHPGRVALWYADKCWTYRELDSITGRLAAALLADGIRPGDRVALLMPNCPELVFCYYACFKIGAVVVPLNARLKAPELLYMLDHAGARILISDASLFKSITGDRIRLAGLEKVFICGDSSTYADTIPFSALSQFSRETPEFPELDESAHAAIMYTSGTTVRPKGVLHTHGSYLATIRSVADTMDLSDEGADEIFAIAVPLYHTSGLALMLLPALGTGRSVLILPRFDPVETLDSLARHKVRYFFGLPFMYDAMLNSPGADDYDLSSLRAAVAGGDSVPMETFAAFRDRFGLDLCGACGMTEVAPYCFNPPYGRKKAGSIGPASAGMHLRVVDAAGKDVGTGNVGEILVKSQAMAKMYWKDEEATREAMVSGWMHTGDLGRQDDEGYIWFAGRKKEIIIRGGSNISPLEVEAVIALHPAVRDVAVTGVSHASLGEVVHAFIVPESDRAVTTKEILDFLDGRLAPYKIPEAVTVVDSLPLGPTGKVNRRALKELLAKSCDPDVHAGVRAASPI